MLPRELRVSRCKAPHKTARAMEARASKSGPSDRKGGDRRDGNSKRPGRKGGEDNGRYVPKPTAESQTMAGRASKLLGRFGGAQLVGKPRGGGGKDNQKRRERKERFMNRAGAGAGGGGGEGGEKSGIKGPEQFVFEGRRASAKDGKPKDLKFKTKSKTKDPRHKKRKSTFGK
jgi:nucleolar protein 12